MSDTARTKVDPEGADKQSPVDLRTDVPHSARVYDYLLGGEDNFEADRATAEESLKANPDGRIPPRENRAFLARAVRFLAEEAGIRQFLDIGTGIPTSPNVHEMAQAVAPEARVVYIDNDPIVLAHARTLLAGHPAGRTEYIDADMRDADELLRSPQVREMLDFDRPVALLMIALLHWVSDDDNPYGLVRNLIERLPSGSYLVLSHLTADFDPVRWERIAEIGRRTGMVSYLRPRAAIERFFDGLELVEPGLQLVTTWRPDPDAPIGSDAPTAAQVSVVGGVARKP